MFSIFKKFHGKNETELPETHLVIKYRHYTSDKNAPDEFFYLSANSGYKECTTNEDFEKTYKRLVEIINSHQRKSPHIKIEINLSGKLKGEDFSKTINDLNLYRYFLTSNELISINIKSEIDIIADFIKTPSFNVNEYMQQFTVKQLKEMDNQISIELSAWGILKNLFNQKLNELFNKNIYDLFDKDLKSGLSLDDQLMNRQIGNEELRAQLIQYKEVNKRCLKLANYCLPVIEKAYSKATQMQSSGISLCV